MQFKVIKDKNFTVMSNMHLKDKSLSLKAKGLLSLMLSLPEDWDYSLRGLEAICKDGRDGIQSGINELRNAGYLHIVQAHSSNGHFAGYDYVIYESPNPDINKSPFTEKPYTEKPYTENPQQLNTKEINILNNIPPISPKCGVNDTQKKSKSTPKKSKSMPKWEPEFFERFWKAYPRGEDRPGAVKVWDSLQPSKETILVMSKALDICKNSDEWKRGIGIPYAVRWLKRMEWENEKLFTPLAAGHDSPPGRKEVVDSWD